MREQEINRKNQIRIDDLSDAELNKFIGEYYYILHSIFPSSGCEQLKDTFREVLKDWAKQNSIKKDVLSKFYATQHADYKNTSILIVQYGILKKAASFIKVFGEMGKYLSGMFGKRYTDSEKRIIMLLLQGFTTQQISEKENVQIDIVDALQYKFGNWLGKICQRNERFGNMRSQFERWLEEQLPNEFPKICFVFGDGITIRFELDCHIPTLKLAFEINGVTHFEPIYGSERFKRTKQIDKLKRELCMKEGIQLFSIDVRDVKGSWNKNLTAHNYAFN